MLLCFVSHLEVVQRSAIHGENVGPMASPITLTTPSFLLLTYRVHVRLQNCCYNRSVVPGSMKEERTADT